MNKKIFSISELNQSSKQLLENSYFNIWVEGEISNFSCPSSGHWYFSLKDNKAQIRCAMFKGANFRIKPLPENGSLVTVRARVTIYEPRGDYQLICDKMEAAGDGLLLKQFEQLKQKLASQGLFQEQHKLSLPEYPLSIGIITSANGAALQDILQILKRRAPFIEITVYDTQVQGNTAPEQIIHALKTAQCDQSHELLILTRGGGSLEDLQAFNHEALAREIYSCKIPVISAVGHEIDFTIADFVADVRAPTPSAAAEIASPELSQLMGYLQYYQENLFKVIQNIIRQHQQALSLSSAKLIHPGSHIETLSQKTDDYSEQLHAAIKLYLYKKSQQLEMMDVKIQHHQPKKKIQAYSEKIDAYQQNLLLSIHRLHSRQKEKLAAIAGKLDSLSPLSIMTRGYSLVSNEKNQLVKSASQLKTGDKIQVRFSDGSIKAEVLND